MEKELYNVNKGLEIALGYIKAASVYNACGRSAVWFSQRYNQGPNKGSVYKFNTNDTVKLNDAFQSIVNKLEGLRLSELTTRAQFIDTMTSVIQIVKPTYLRDVILKCDKTYWKHRVTKNIKSDGQYRFTADDINKMNEGLRTISEKLSSIYLIP